MKRVLLLMHSESYKARDFLDAAERLDIDLVIGSDRQDVLAELNPGHSLVLDFCDDESSLDTITAAHGKNPFEAIVPTEDIGVPLAARVSERLNLPTNSLESALSARDKYVFREIQLANGLFHPWFKKFPTALNPALCGQEVEYPCVLKPLFLNASRGVIRVNNPAEFEQAFDRIKALLACAEVKKQGGLLAEYILAEGYIPGDEVVLEGVLSNGILQKLAIFDKPDPLEGPFFEETLFITPSRHSESLQNTILQVAQSGAYALGLRTGPVHAELRLNAGKVFLLEIAPRSIGGHCSRSLLFNEDISLEALILRQATGGDTKFAEREPDASGVMMIPMPGKGVLKAVRGIDAARMTPLVTDIEVTIPLGQEVIPLPEGNRYLGFIFAKGPMPQQVEQALREAHAKLTFVIEETGESPNIG